MLNRIVFVRKYIYTKNLNMIVYFFIFLATGYYILLGTDFDRLQNEFTYGTSLPSQSPRVAGEVEMTSFIIPDVQTTFFLCIRAVDDSNNVAECSNIVSMSSITDSRWMQVNNNRFRGTDDTVLIGISVASGIACVILAVMVMLVAFKRCTNKSTNDKLPFSERKIEQLRYQNQRQFENMANNRLNNRYLSIDYGQPRIDIERLKAKGRDNKINEHSRSPRSFNNSYAPYIVQGSFY